MSVSLEDCIKDVWTALSDYRENCIPEGDENYDEQWDDLCFAMEHITNAADSSAMLEELKDTWDIEEFAFQHSKYQKWEWRYDVREGETILGYWEWVLHHLTEDGESVHDHL